jgi:23S rRNA maturation-related 3'-5' exoribonuclease YhaM
VKEINKIIEMSAVCCVQLVINIHKNKVYFISIKHAFTETSFSSADMLTCDKQTIAKKSESDRSSTQIPFGT